MIHSKFIDTNQSFISKEEKYRLSQLILNSITKKMEEIQEEVKLMHICGTHEATVARSGLRSLIPHNLRIIAGPGCPVCVCPNNHISTAIELAKKGNIITSFGDMLKVPNSRLESLYKARAQGFDIRIMYSVKESVELALNNPNKSIIWLGVGFETTAPMTSYILENKIPKNFFVLSDFRLVPPAMRLLSEDPQFDLNGYILPGHVSTITGINYFKEFPLKYKIPCVVAGFDSLEFLYALDIMLNHILNHQNKISNAYAKVVTEAGNKKAQQSINHVFDIVNAKWRGIGEIKNSGLELKSEYDEHNARFLLEKNERIEEDLPKGCKCGLIILGKNEPENCPHFLHRCNPDNPIGPCMVSDEGTCRIRATYMTVK